jgi:hypothetical protein
MTAVEKTRHAAAALGATWRLRASPPKRVLKKMTASSLFLAARASLTLPRAGFVVRAYRLTAGSEIGTSFRWMSGRWPALGYRDDATLRRPLRGLAAAYLEGQSRLKAVEKTAIWSTRKNLSRISARIARRAHLYR